MRAWLIMIWLMIPIGMAYHWFSPQGVERRRRDAITGILDDARANVRAASQTGDTDEAGRLLAEARGLYEEAIEKLPASQANRIYRNQMNLEKAAVVIRQGSVEEGLQEIQSLMEALRGKQWPDDYEDNFRAAAAAGIYQSAAAMRLMGYGRSEWVRVADDARQQYCMLSEKHGGEEMETSHSLKKNLEESIRLVRMDLSTLDGDPLPEPPRQGQSKSKKKKKKKDKSKSKGFRKAEPEPGN